MRGVFGTDVSKHTMIPSILVQSETARRPREIVTEIVRLSKEVLGEDVAVFWFGSWPRGTATPHSDIDIAISTATPVLPEHFAKLREAIDDIRTLYHTDLVDFNAVGPLLRREIEQYGVKL